jgi:glycosyltransferase involved in cell wall biosynthesis
MKVCMVIPHFDHVDQFQKLLPALAGFKLPLIIVDDASPTQAFSVLTRLVDDYAPGSIVIGHPKNLGKGGAMITGLDAAQKAGFTHAIQIDADGQHDVRCISQLVSVSCGYPERIICGLPEFDESISKLRFYSRHITLFFARVETLSTEIHDALCGFRLYPLKQTVTLLNNCNPGKRMTFDPEILVRAVWAGIPLLFIPVKVRYPTDGKSHFRYFRDNVEISWMHTRLIFGMLIRLPMLLRRILSRKKGHTIP